MSSLRVLRIRERSRSFGVCPSAATSGIMLTPVSNPDRPSTSSGNARTAGPMTPPMPPPLSVSADVQADRAPVGGEHLDQADGSTTTAFRSEEHRHERDGDADGLAEPEQEHAAEDEQQDHGDGHRVAVEDVGEERVLQHVHGRRPPRTG